MFPSVEIIKEIKNDVNKILLDINGIFCMTTYTVDDQINWNDKQIKLSEVIR